MSIFDKILKFLGIRTFANNMVDALWIEAKEKFPHIIRNIKEGIAAVDNDDLSGGEKAVKVAVEVMQTAPLVLQQLPQAKAFFVHAVTQVYAEGQKELLAEIKKLLGKL